MEGKFRHLGHLVFDCFRTRPDAICRIDAATGETETNASILSRSIRLANCLNACGLAPGDTVALSGRNHLDLHVPYYAALFNGLPLLGVDPLFKYDEIKSLLKITSPKIVFCEQEDRDYYARAAQELGLTMKIVTFGDAEDSMDSFVHTYQNGHEEDYELPEFDLDKVYLWLISTSGTSGAVKVAAFDHYCWYRKAMAYTAAIKVGDMAKENKPALNLSPIQWVSGMFNPVGMPLLGQTIVQTSAPPTTDHVIEIINKYKPRQALLGPTTICHILNHEKQCNWTCFDSLILGGARISTNLITELGSQMRPDARAVEMYGTTETLGPPLLPHKDTPLGSCGSPVPLYQIKLVDPDTGVVVTEPNVSGEMYIKGPIFKEYYNNPEETKKAITEDGWYKSGDVFYRDESNNYFYVERLKMMIKYRNYQIAPAEIEAVIMRHPGVAEVVVGSVPHAVDGDHAVACVVLKRGATVTEDEIKQIVASNLSENKQLRGGVVFFKSFPLTSTGKVSLREVMNITRNKLTT